MYLCIDEYQKYLKSQHTIIVVINGDNYNLQKERVMIAIIVMLFFAIWCVLDGDTSNTIKSVECPYCKSTNTKKISCLSKAGSVALFGIFALGKTTKQWHCNDCGSDF